jgi:hypothetical protein
VYFSIRANDHIFIFARSERVEPYQRHKRQPPTTTHCRHITNTCWQHQQRSNGNSNGMPCHNRQLPTATPTMQQCQCQWPMPTPCHITTANCQPPITNIRQCCHITNTNNNEVATPTPTPDANTSANTGCQCQCWMLAPTPDDDTSPSHSNAGGFFLSFNLCAG